MKEQLQSEEERLRAQGVPREVIAGMRTFDAHTFARRPAVAARRGNPTTALGEAGNLTSVTCPFGSADRMADGKLL